MFGIDSTELLVIALVALVIIGPKDLPKVMRTVGNFVGRARGMARHFRSGIDTMMREAELEEMEKKWKADNERIMHDYPAIPAAGDALPAAAQAVPDWEAEPPLPPSGKRLPASGKTRKLRSPRLAPDEPAPPPAGPTELP